MYYKIKFNSIQFNNSYHHFKVLPVCGPCTVFAPRIPVFGFSVVLFVF